ncbi:sensor histidine kinase [Caulobacter sp. RL271]|uniref:Sensor histidine kinase n=1 Tax=Caulobacter segnis TaxID=88688 RepID=A0ABY4ZNH9_9CAUL|nr:sensor histidine kinase [Caulobacter segnis]USQ94136.1 sensor histidine kinase [Caulobacter segnis]
MTLTSLARDIAPMDPATTSRSKDEANSAPLADGLNRRRWSLIFLSYLPFYFIAWLFRRPGTLEIVASVAGMAAFVGLFYWIWVRRGRPTLWHVLAIFCIGVALSRFNVGWSVYTIYAMSFAARLPSRRLAVRTMVGMELLLLAMGPLFLNYNWPVWASGVLFGGITGFAGLMQADVERKNQELAVAHEEVRALATMAERERISRDLHDLLGHTLTLVAVKAELAAKLVSRDAAAAEREMQSVAAAAREALSEVRTAVVGMKGASLTTELERARTALAAANIQAEISSAEIQGHPGQEAVLAMALREAVTNVIRHAGATRCQIRVAPSPVALTLSIVDDGRGGSLVEGSGLKGMRTRLSAIGGDLDVVSDESGTRLVAIAPVEPAS